MLVVTIRQAKSNSRPSMSPSDSTSLPPIPTPLEQEQSDKTTQIQTKRKRRKKHRIDSECASKEEVIQTTNILDEVSQNFKETTEEQETNVKQSLPATGISTPDDNRSTICHNNDDPLIAIIKRPEEEVTKTDDATNKKESSSTTYEGQEATPPSSTEQKDEYITVDEEHLAAINADNDYLASENEDILKTQQNTTFVNVSEPPISTTTTTTPDENAKTKGIDASEVTFIEADTQSLLQRNDDPSDLTVSVVTWNLAELAVLEEETSFLQKFRTTPRCASDSDDGSDIVLISGQECENIKPRRSEGHRSRDYRRWMIKRLGKKYVPLAIHSLGGIQFGLFCKHSILGDVELCSIADVTCGVGNVFHNKGAVAAFLKLKARERDSDTNGPRRKKSVTMLLVTAHMAAHVNNVEARNMDYWRIASELESQAPPQFLQPKMMDSSPEGIAATYSGSYLMESVDRIFFCGDLNYRLNVPREFAEFTVSEIKRLLASKQRQASSQAETLRLDLMRHDQLHHSISENAAFPGFSEGKITFSPTFKFDKGTNDYDTSNKQRIPAWTDRVLFKPFGVRVLDYTSEEESMQSDHRPVHATFRVSMQGQELPLTKGKKNRSRSVRREVLQSLPK